MFTDQAALQELIKVSIYAGSRIDLVQAGGGNTSTKTSDRMMYIKASGFQVRDIARGEGIASVDCRLLMQEHSGLNHKAGMYLSPKAFERWNQQCITSDKNLRPSIEVSMHALLGPVVLHTHPVTTTAFLCVEGSKALIDNLFHGQIEFLYVPYAKPGIELGIVLMQALQALREISLIRPDVIFLENHGMVVHGDTAEEVIQIHETVLDIFSTHHACNSQIQSFQLSEPEDSVDTKILTAIRLSVPELPCLTCIRTSYEAITTTSSAPTSIENSILFPDAAVFCGAHFVELDVTDITIASTIENRAHLYRKEWGQPPRIWRAGDVYICAGATPSDALSVAEVWWAHETGCFLARRLGMPRYLPAQRVHELLNWEAELYRKTLSARKTS